MIISQYIITVFYVFTKFSSAKAAPHYFIHRDHFQQSLPGLQASAGAHS